MRFEAPSRAVGWARYDRDRARPPCGTLKSPARARVTIRHDLPLFDGVAERPHHSCWKLIVRRCRSCGPDRRVPVVRPSAEARWPVQIRSLSPHLNLAAGTWLDTVQRKPADAEQRAVAWSSTELAPRAAYLWRASYQIQKRDYPQALSTLETGAGRLGDRSLFLPQMIAVARGGGDLTRADELGLECSRAGAGVNLANMAKLLEQTGNKVAARPTGVYAECVAALGYDPVQRREQALKTQPAAGQKELSDFSKKLATN